MSEETEDARALRRIMYAPRRVIREETYHAPTFQDLDGRIGISYYEDRFNIRPLLSFQVYVIHETSDRHEDMAALAESLYREIMHQDEAIPARLDIHFMGAIPVSEAPSACIAHYRAAKEAHADDPDLRLVPSYGMDDEDWRGFLITVPRADWRENGGLGLVYFDHVCDPKEVWHDVGEEPLSDPLHIYPTRQVHSGEFVEKQDRSFQVQEGGNLWHSYIAFIYIRIEVQEEWEELYQKKHNVEREKWAREELARRKAKAKAKAEEEASHEAEDGKPSQE